MSDVVENNKKSNVQVQDKRYQSLVLSIAAFLSLIALLLAFTFYTSNLLERNATLMNETNRVSNSAQAVIKDLFDLENSYGEDTSSPHIQTVLKRLKTNGDIISSRLPLIKEGGSVESHDGESVTLPAASSQVAKDSLAVAEAQWALLSPKIDAYLKDADNVLVDSSDELVQAANQAKTSSLRINESLDALVADTAASTAAQANTIRLIQIIGVAVILAYFLIFIFFFVRRLRDADAEALATQREIQEIMQTVNTGLFLLNKDLKVGNQYSNALEGIIGTNRLAGESLSSILRNRISDKDLKVAEEFVEQLYKPHVKEKLVNSLNPLHKVMIHDGQGAGDSRYLDFTFSRVYEGKDIARILVNVNDVSEAVRLEQRLEKERAQNDRQIEMLTTILNVSPRVINDFISNTYVHIERMNNTLKNPGSSQFELEGKLKSIYREMHSLKGEASALKLHSFTQIASEAEDKLHALQNQGRLSGNDFLPLTVQLDELLSLSNTIRELGERINANQGGVSVQAAPAPTEMNLTPVHESDNEPLDENVSLEDDEPVTLSAPAPVVMDAKAELGDYLVQFAQDIAERQRKNIEVDVSQLAGVYIPSTLNTTVREICVQLLRNAIVHGIADSATRERNGKHPVGKITLSFAENAGANHDHFMFAVEDDGLGIDYDAIREKLINSGKYPLDRVAEFSKAQLLNTLFSSGFSTKAVADEDGGRGVGLDIVKDRVKSHGGKINVQSEKGKFTRFIVKLPMNATRG
ncbi:MAG: ATP-binding protein [Moraxella sp.]|nr:ATP-binding protein [Moraxella sp.]